VTRALLVLLCLALIALALLGMRLGWRNRLRRQAGLPALPQPPAEPGEPTLPAMSGLYVGTTFDTSWQDRVLHEGLGERATATATLYAAGTLIEREGAAPIFIPASAVTEARLLPALAGKVVGEGGLLVISWQLGEAILDTALRADDKTAYPAWIRAINGKVTA
jgi:hypothetical protein